MILLFGAFLGFISVAFGAYSEHGLRPVISDEHYRFLLTAIRYNQVNSVVISAIGLSLFTGSETLKSKLLNWSGILFIIGTLLFSFSIYLSVTFDIPALVYVTPVGGITMMVAWLTLVGFACLRLKTQRAR